ncbi:MAG: hypothetical protein KY452_08615 [Actinobacteria bacterium]|nr:hypothetical protein [Actinomycetota bacterium]
MESGRARRWKGPVPGGWSVAAVKNQAPSTTTTVLPVAETAPPRTKTLPSTTTRTLVTATTTPDRQPVYDANGIPQVTASPGQGGVGATIHVDGHGFTDGHWIGTDFTVWLSGPGRDPDCVRQEPWQLAQRRQQAVYGDLVGNLMSATGLLGS